MLMLSFIALGVLMAAAALITVLAVLRAKDGYEDETGFQCGAPPPLAQKARRQPEWMRQLHAVVNRSAARPAPPPRAPTTVRQAVAATSATQADAPKPRELVAR